MDATVWALSFVASIAAVAGAALGTVRIAPARRGRVTSYRGWHAWHHLLGLTCATFVLTWIFSGWLSMDHGLLFSTGKLTEAEAMVLARAPDWDSLPASAPLGVSAQVREAEWFSFDARPTGAIRSASIPSVCFPTIPAARRRGDAYLTAAEVRKPRAAPPVRLRCGGY